jgi:glucose-6-phosphate-specific signal transduction histidine kinase
MNRAQRKTYEKSIKQFNEAAKSLDSESADAFRAWQNLSDRLPPNFLDDLKINRRILDLIDNLPDAELAKIIGKDEKFIVKFFSDK